MAKKDTERDKQILFARKIKRLADEGDPGERENAKSALERYLLKKGLSAEDILDVPMQEYSVVITKETEKLMKQVIASVIGQPAVRGRYKRGRTVFFKSTYAEYIEIKDRFAHFWVAYQNELELFYSAFVQKNHIYANPDLDDNKEDEAMTPEEKARIWKILQMMEGLTPETYFKKLNQ